MPQYQVMKIPLLFQIPNPEVSGKLWNDGWTSRYAETLRSTL